MTKRFAVKNNMNYFTKQQVFPFNSDYKPWHLHSSICSLKNISWAGITMLASQHSRDVHRNDIPPVFSLWAAEQWKGASRAAQCTTSSVLPGLWTTKQEDLRVGREVPRVHLVLPEDDALDVLHLRGLNPPLFLESCGEKPLGFGFLLFCLLFIFFNLHFQPEDG